MNPTYSPGYLPSDAHNPNTFLAKMIVRMKVASSDLLADHGDGDRRLLRVGTHSAFIWTTPFGGVNIQLGQISKCKNLTFVGDKIPCRFIIPANVAIWAI